MDNGKLKMDNVGVWRWRVLSPSFSIIHLSFSIRAKRACPPSLRTRRVKQSSGGPPSAGLLTSLRPRNDDPAAFIFHYPFIIFNSRTARIIVQGFCVR
ncbi:MAG: hypothetical protein LBT00_08525 [Spirochaetaceae bacterium]|nr:hypothetical protein [Spirochaetaceae bacterium]